MSHTMNIKIELHDRAALEAACQRLGLSFTEGTHKLYATNENGIGIKLPGWQYPIVVKSDGTIAYDNYNGHWGKIEELNKLRAYYGLEKAKIEARKKGYSVYETQDQEGNLVLRIQVGG